jgi:hypothetical protein
MPISTSPTTPIIINSVVLLAYKRAGVLPVEATTAGANMAAKLSHGKTLLDLILDNLAVEGFMARTMSFHDLTVVAGTASYTLPDTLLDVYEDAVFTETGETTELICKQIDIATWQTLTDKTTESTRPQLYTVFKDGELPVVELWPVPSVGGTLRLKSVRLLGENQTGTNSPDLQRYWLDVLVWLLAWYVAVDSSMPAETIAMLQMTAMEKKKGAVRFSFERPSQQAIVSYSTQWSP